MRFLFFWNPALAAHSKGFEISVMSRLLGAGLYNEDLAALITTGAGTVGFHARLIHQGSFEEFAIGETTGKNVGYADLAIGAGFAHEFKKMFSIGASVSFLYSKLGVGGTADDYSLTSMMGNIGLALRLDALRFGKEEEKNLRFGVVVKNLGPKASFMNGGGSQKLPLEIRSGFFWRPVDYVDLALDYAYRFDAPKDLSVGLEFMPFWYLNPRGGILLSQGAMKPSFGMGVRIKTGASELRLDYGATRSVFSGFNHAVSLSFRRLPLGLAGVGVKSVLIDDIFPAMYKYYGESNVAKVEIENGSSLSVKKVVVSMFVKDYMDFPTQGPLVGEIKPGQTVTLRLPASFNNKVLEITEDTPLQAQIEVKYLIQNQEKSLQKIVQFKMYNRNAMTWSDISRLAAFVTPRDPAVGIFARGVLQKMTDSFPKGAPESVLKAAAIFDALGTIGVTYVLDPSSPVRQREKSVEIVDSIQYPRDTLRFRTGDCDDTTVLFCSLLENVGIKTVLLDDVEHIFMMFDTGVSARQASSLSQNPNTVTYQGTVWIPVETTFYKKGFAKAWPFGAREYDLAKKKDSLTIVPVSPSWEVYPPVTLPASTWEPEIPSSSLIMKLFDESRRVIKK